MNLLWWMAVLSAWLCVSFGVLAVLQATSILPVGVAGLALIAAAGLLRPRWAIMTWLLSMALYVGIWLWLERETGNPAAVLAAVIVSGASVWFSREVHARVAALYRAGAGQRRELDAATPREPSGALKLERGMAALVREVERCRRYQTALTVLALGIASPQEWVAVHGGRQLAAMEHSLAEFLLQNVRIVDVVVHSGRAEYMVLLPDTSIEHALPMARRLAHGARQQLETEIRFGLAEFPRNGVSSEELVEEAQAALSFARSAELTMASLET